MLQFLLYVTSVFSRENNVKGFANTSPGFIENKGQIIDQNNMPNPAVLYLLNTPGMNVQLREGGFSYDLYSPPRHKERGPGGEVRYHRIDINLEGTNPCCQIIPSDPLSDYFNYFTANTSASGIKNVRQCAKVTYQNIYPGIDIEFFTNDEHGYKYNFVIHPGGNIKDIRLKIEGPDDISLIGDTLKYATRFGDVEELIPESYYSVSYTHLTLPTIYSV